MKRRLSGILTLLMVLVVQIAFAQQQKLITGTVVDGGGLPLPGVNVLVKNTSRGTQTDFDGNYSINADIGQVLVFSYVGFETVEYPVDNISRINVTMTENAAELEEVVVVGYGTATKRSFTGTASVVSGESLERKSVSDVSQALAGEAAGVRVINSSGQPGEEGTIRIRGIGSVNGNRDPLYVVDGVPYSGNISAINPADIESTTILKDAAATAIYGARGANGVVVINTRTGKKGSSQIDVEIKTGQNFDLLDRTDVIKDPDLYLGLSWEAMYNRGMASGSADPAAFANSNLFSASGLDPKYNYYNVPGDQIIDPATGLVRPGLERKYTPENWEDYAFQPANRTEANVKMSGGNEKSTYYTSFGYLDDQGYSINSDFERFSTRINVSHEVKDWLRGTMDVGYSRSETNNLGQSEDSGSVFWFVDNIPAIYPLFLRDENGGFVPDPYFDGNQYDFGEGRGFGALTNSIAGAYQDVNNTMRHEVNTNIFFDATITEDLSFETRFGSQYFNEDYFNRGNPFYGGSAQQNGSLYKQQTERLSYNFLQLLRYKNSFGGHTLEAFVAHESNSFDEFTMFAYRSNMVTPDATELNQAVVNNPPGSYTIDYTLESYFGQINYDFDDTYFLSGTIRRDGSSRFLQDKWGTFGSVGGAYVMSNAGFMQDQNIFSFLKLKASYGLLGDQAGVGYYPGVDLFNVDNLNDEISLSFRTKGNPDLTWETSKMFQTGVEFNLGNYFEGNIDYYNKITDDQIFERRTAPSLGYAIILVNDGKLKNEGLEFMFTGHILKSDNYFLDLSINGELPNNEMLAMPIEPATGVEKVLDQQGLYGRSTGHSIYDFYIRDYAGVDPADGVGMWYSYYVDADGNGKSDGVLMQDGGEVISSLHEYRTANPDMAGNIDVTTTKKYNLGTQKYVGKSAIPDVRGAVNLTTGVGNFSLSAQLLYQFGGYGYDAQYATLMNNDVIGSNNWHTDILGRWQKPGDITDVPRLSSNYEQNVSRSSTRFLRKIDYVSLNNVRLGYQLPTSIVDNIGMSSFNIWVSGDNLMLFSDRAGWNPQTAEAGGSDTYTYSPLSTVTLGVRAKF
ncbi:MAG: SusC/RagA family TonB-linked outer membrane protein [Salinimicrobium sp.]